MLLYLERIFIKMENKIIFEEIQKANDTIRTTNIKGKEYAEVNQRIKAFRMVYPVGSIRTEMISNENGICIFRAVITDNENKIIATGTAYEKENSTFINKTSYIENCETSAVGRALGMAGFGIDTSVASAEEVQNAIANQEEQNRKITEEQIKQIQKLVTNIDDMLVYYKVSSMKIEDMLYKDAEEVIKRKSK
jgi:ribosomal protein S13